MNDTEKAMLLAMVPILVRWIRTTVIQVQSLVSFR